MNKTSLLVMGFILSIILACQKADDLIDETIIAFVKPAHFPELFTIFPGIQSVKRSLNSAKNYFMTPSYLGIILFLVVVVISLLMLSPIMVTTSATGLTIDWGLGTVCP